MKCKENIKDKHALYCHSDIRGMDCSCDENAECGEEMNKIGSVMTGKSLEIKNEENMAMKAEIMTLYQCPTCRSIVLN